MRNGLLLAGMVLTSGLAAPAEAQARSWQSYLKFNRYFRVSARPANIKGTVPVLMYHKVGPVEKNMMRSAENFRRDLERLYRMGYRPVTLRDYVGRRMDLSPGASPVVFTFDDSHETQFRFLPDGNVDPNCAVGIWQSFAAKHPDFPVRATFFILPNGPFGNKADGLKKIDLLKSWGCEIASHTMTHRPLARLSDAQVKKELGASYMFLESLGVQATSFAPPYGVMPRNQKVFQGYRYLGRPMRYHNVVLVGANPAPSPYSTRFNRRRIPRIKAYEGPLGIVYWLNRVSNGKSDPYVEP